MDIRMYSLYGYNKKVDEFTKELVNKSRSEMDMVFIRAHHYTDEHRKKLDDLDVLARQMIDRKFIFLSTDGTMLLGTVKGFDWDDAKVTIEFQLTLDREPDACIEYSANIHSTLRVNGDKVIIGDEGCDMPFDPEGVAPNTLGVML